MKKGFTLVELVVILSIFGILMIAGTDFLIQAVRNSNRSAMENEVRQNAGQILQDIDSEAKKADPSIGFTYVAGNGNLSMTTVNSSPTRVVSYATNANGILTKTITIGGVPGASAVLNSNSVSVLNCPLSGTGCPAGACTKGLVVSQPTISDPLLINLTVESNSSFTRTDYCAKLSLTDSVTARQY